MMMSRDLITERLAAVDYVADSELPVALQLMEMLGRPLLLEGEAGVGKTEVAKALAAAHGAELIRLQCYEGLDQNAALYEWNYQRQLLAIKTREGIGESPNVGGVPCFSNAVNDAFKFLGATHIQMPHDAWRTWTAAEKLGLHT